LSLLFLFERAATFTLPPQKKGASSLLLCLRPFQGIRSVRGFAFHWFVTYLFFRPFPLSRDNSFFETEAVRKLSYEGALFPFPAPKALRFRPFFCPDEAVSFSSPSGRPLTLPLSFQVGLMFFFGNQADPGLGGSGRRTDRPVITNLMPSCRIRSVTPFRAPEKCSSFVSFPFFAEWPSSLLGQLLDTCLPGKPPLQVRVPFPFPITHSTRVSFPLLSSSFNGRANPI